MAQEVDENNKTFVMKSKVGTGSAPLLPALVPSWSTASVTYTPWANSGAVYDCSEWAAPVSLVNLFESFTQSRSCQQDQSRTRSETLASQRLGSTRNGGVTIESRTITVNQSQPAQGTRDYITDNEAERPWSPWTRVGSIYGCDAFSPAVDTVNEGETFTQSRTCSEDQTRSRDVFEEYRSGNNVFLRTDNESRTLPFNETREAVGTYVEFYVVSQTVEYTGWSYAAPSCSAYFPFRNTVDYGEPMTISRYCTRNRSRSAITYDVYNDGSRIEASRERVTENYGYNESYNTTGTRDIVVSQRVTGYGPWEGVFTSCKFRDPGYRIYEERRVYRENTYASGRVVSADGWETRYSTC